MSVLEIGVDSALRFAPERFWTEEKPCRAPGSWDVSVLSWGEFGERVLLGDQSVQALFSV